MDATRWGTEIDHRHRSVARHRQGEPAGRPLAFEGARAGATAMVPAVEPADSLYVRWCKPVIDRLAAGVLFVLTLPLMLVVAVTVLVTLGRPVLYRQLRVGQGGETFRVWKFRTMYVDAAERQAELEDVNEAEGPLFKIREDPRVTAVGRMLRRFSLDEVPNVINVLRGEMSLVGPRPLPIRDYELLDEWHRKRSGVLPGITGLWQIAGRSDLSFDELVRLDFYYIERWSLWLDVTILAKTVPAVIAHRGAY
jgi:lipopolysaccharide/colanic/teichoic acid biosynthesis glycosyltransferase